jgi:cytochrome P450
MVQATEQMIGSWADNERRDIQADMMRLTLGVACQTLFGAEICPNPEVVGRAMQSAMESLVEWAQSAIPLPSWVPTPVNVRFNRALRELDAIVDGLIESRRQNPAGDDLLWALLSAHDEAGDAMSDRQLRDEVRTLFIAGHETTALTLTYALYLLAGHSDVQQALHRELSTELGSRPADFSDLPRLTLLRGVVMESLRLYPPADTIGREATGDCTIGSLHIRKGTNVFMSQWVVHRDARFFPNPDQFVPGRWTDDFERELPRFAFFPFGGGPRACIGQTFAMTESMLVLATLCRHRSFAPDPSYRLELRPTLTLRPRDNVRMVVRAAPVK